MFFGGGFPGGFPGFEGGGPGGPHDDGPVDNEAYYKTLGVEKTASADDIKKAYRKLAKTHHPDKGGDQALFKEITEAYEVLSDPEKKELYDQGGKQAVERGSAGGGAGDLFSQLFSGGRQRGSQAGRERKGEPVVHKLTVTLENLYKGRTFKMAINRQRVKYPDGMSPKDATTTCATCQGQGVVLRVQRMGPMVQHVQSHCPDCKGAGKSFKQGVTTFQDKKQLEVRVEPGMKAGQKIVLSGEADEQPGLEPGDVVFVLQQVEHAVFQRTGADLVMEKEISLQEALCGVKFAFKHLDDRQVVVHSAPGQTIKPNSLKMVLAEGMPRYKRPFEKGRLFVLFRVKFPDSLTPEVCAALRQALPLDPAPATLPAANADNVEVVETPMMDATADDFGRTGFSAESAQAYDSDDDDERGGGGQRVQCANQ